MRWTSSLAIVSFLFLTSIWSCKSGPNEEGPKSQELKFTSLEEGEAAALRERAQGYLDAFIAQDFDAMWSFMAEEAKKEIGIAQFVETNMTRRAGNVVSSELVSIDGLGEELALVKTLINFRFNPTIFSTSEPFMLEIVWENRWVKNKTDELWYRLNQDDDELKERLKRMEEVCGSYSTRNKK